VTAESYWIAERPQYYVQTGAAFENPYGMPRAEIERYIANHTAENVAQVIYGKYVDNSGLVFTGELVAQLFADDAGAEPIRDQSYWDVARWRQARNELEVYPDEYRFHIGIDVARKKDSTVITVLDVHAASIQSPARVLYWRRTNRVPWDSIYAEVGRAAWLFPGQMLVDATGGMGDAVMEELETRFYCPRHHSAFHVGGRCPKHKRAAADVNAPLTKDWPCDPRHWVRLDPNPYIFSSKSKVDLINNLQALMGRGYDEEQPERAFGVLRSPPIIPLQEELGEYAWEDKKLQTDSVMSFALAAWSGLEDLPLPPAEGSIHGD
jgi:hypothetical protein